MRIGIYDRWLGTLGGGERHCLTVAEHFSRRHEVSVIGHTPQVRNVIESRFALDLSAVSFLDLPECSTAQLTALTSDFDIFINASQGDFICSRAARSAWLVYFPVPIYPGSTARLRARVGRELRRRMKFITFVEGVYGVQRYRAIEARGVGPKAVINVRPSILGYDIMFGLAATDNQVHRVRVALDYQFVEQITLPANGELIDCCVTAPGRSGETAHKLELETDCLNTPPAIVITEPRINHPLYLTYRRFLENMFPAWGLRLENVPDRPEQLREAVASYHAIWPISEFARVWTERYWQRTGPVIYPAVDVNGVASGAKRRQILNVGRFFAGSHNKQHLVLIATFKRMVSKGLVGWELHLAGGTSAGGAHRKYLKRVQDAAQNSAIFLHTDVAPDDLARLYAESVIYWHAGGYGADPQREPIRFEHFGISIVEAMAAACVPVVFGYGGPVEIVQNGHNGFHWRTPDELIAQTMSIIADMGLRESLLSAAHATSRFFDRSHFQQRLETAFQELKPE